MIVAMIAMRMMQPAVNQVVKMIAMRHQRMPASFMAAVTRDWRAAIRIRRADFHYVLIIVTFMLVVQVTIV